MTASETIASTDDARVQNTPVRHQYRVLSDAEKVSMAAIKDKGQEFLDLLDAIRTPPVDEGDGYAAVVHTFDRELNIAVERVEEAVMWAVKHVTR